MYIKNKATGEIIGHMAFLSDTHIADKNSKTSEIFEGLKSGKYELIISGHNLEVKGEHQVTVPKPCTPTES